MNAKNENRPGYRKTTVGWIPQDWEATSLGSVTQRVGDGIHTTPVYVERSQYYFVNGNNLMSGRVVIFPETKCVSEDEYLKHRKELGAFTLLLSINGTVGNVAYYQDEPVILGKSAAYINCGASLCKHYAFAFLASIKAHGFFRGEWTGSTIKNLSLASLRQMPISLPSLPEQEAIAEVLECWDKAIRNYEKKIEKKRNIKKGLMQALLSGKIRLPGFGPARSKLGIENSECGIPEGWTEVRLGEMCSLCKEKYQPNEQEDLKCLELEHIEKETGRIVGYTSSSAQSSMKTRFKPGCVLFGKLRPYLQKFARPQFTGVCSTEIWVLLPNEREVSGDFLFWLVQSRRFNAAATVTSGSKMPRADWRHLSSRVFCIPTIGEQQAIASFLSAADTAVEALERKLAVLKDQKRFLLNTLVTGTIRLPQFVYTKKSADTKGDTE